MPQRYAVREAGGPNHWVLPRSYKNIADREYRAFDRGYQVQRDCHETCAGLFEGPHATFAGRRPANFRFSTSPNFNETVYLALTFELRELPCGLVMSGGSAA